MENIMNMETIKSKDGTSIAFERTGSGPPLVLVHGGGASDHKRWEIGGVRTALAENYTVYAIDRRGRGGSGDNHEYNPEREYEDVVAVVDSIDEPVILLGHSLGANISLEAALRTDNIRRLILYEPAFPAGDHEITSEEVVADMQALIDNGENEQALMLFMREVASLSQEEIDAFRKDPWWQSRIDSAPTLPREERFISGYEFDGNRFTNLNTPALLLTGSESPPLFRVATKAVHNALPNSRIVTLDGQAHIAMNTAPELFLREVMAFLNE
jgi:pimeloyl-ACP methyl ester carboxylesterase